MIPSRAWRQQRAAVLSSSDGQLAHGTSCRERLVPRRLRRLDEHPRGTTVNRGARSGLRRIGPCRRRGQAAQDRLDRRETTLDRGGGGTPPRRASGHTPRPNRNSRVRLAGKLRARILHRRTDGGIRPAHGAVARRLRAQAIGRRKVAENSALSRTGCPSTITKTGAGALISSRLRNSMNTAAVTRPFVSMKRSCPRALTAEIRLAPKRAPVLDTTGVRPRLPQVVPLCKSERTPASSAKKICAPSRRARRRIAGYSVSNHRFTASGFC